MTHPRSNKNCRAYKVQKTDVVIPSCEGISAHRREEREALCGEDKTCNWLPPYAPPSLASISQPSNHWAMVSPSPGRHVQPCLWTWKRGNRQEATALRCSQNGGPLGSKAPSSPAQNSAAGALLCAQPLGSALGNAGRGTWYVSAQGPDVTTAPLQSHLSAVWSGPAARGHFGIPSNAVKSRFGGYGTRCSQALLNTAVACRCCLSLGSPCYFSLNTNHRPSQGIWCALTEWHWSFSEVCRINMVYTGCGSGFFYFNY